MRFICISLLVALSSFSSCLAGRLIRSSSFGSCESLAGIEGVQTTCAWGGTAAAADECFLECANTGYFEREDWKNIFCKTVDNNTSWFTKNDERVTLQMIKDENLCKNSSQEESSGRRRREALPCYMPRGWTRRPGGQDYC